MACQDSIAKVSSGAKHVSSITTLKISKPRVYATPGHAMFDGVESQHRDARACVDADLSKCVLVQDGIRHGRIFSPPKFLYPSLSEEVLSNLVWLERRR